MAGDGIERASAGQLAQRADATNAGEAQMVGVLGLKAARETRAEEHPGATVGRALGDEFFTQVQGFATALLKNHTVARTNPLSQIQGWKLDRLHQDAPTGKARMCWARLSKGPSTMRPSKSMVPRPFAMAAS